MNYIRPERELTGDRWAEKHRHGRNFAMPQRERPDGAQSGRAAKTAAWTKSLTRAIAFAEARQAKVIGVSGVSSDAGTSVVAEGLAQIYSEFDRRILLVDASTVTLSRDVVPSAETVPDLSALSTAVTNKYSRVDLSDPRMTLPPNSEFFRYVFELALTQFEAIVVDLPSAAGEAGRPAPAFLAVGPACNSLFLVCVTGRTTRSEVQQCLASCKISGANVEGILLNDFRLPASALLSES